MQLIDMISYWGRTDPHRRAVIQPDMVTSYQALVDAIQSIGERIERLALDRSEPIAVSIASPSYFIAAVLAALEAGYAVALVNQARFPFLASAGIRNLISDTQGQMLSGGRNIRFDQSWLPRAKPDVKRAFHRKGQAVGGDLIYFTSGTTGMPKTVVQSAGALQDLLQYPYTCASGPQQKILVMPGLSSTFGFNRICEVLNAGKTACLAPDGASALALITLFGVEVVIASAAQALELLGFKERYPGYDVNSISSLFVGGGNVAPEAIARMRASLCRHVVNQYGSTEAGVIALTPFDILDDAPGGVPLPWVDIQVVDEAGQELPPGGEGLIRCRTPQLMENLERQGDLPSVKNGWFYPGDVGAMTADGALRIHGRSSDVINRGGVKVSGSRIELILQALPEIQDAAACGVVGPSGMEELWIAVVPKGPVDADQIKARLRDHQDVGVAPDQIIVVDELPRGELGKVQKFRLKELLLSRQRA